MSDLAIIGMIVGSAVSYVVIGMVSFFIMTEVAKFRNTEECGILSVLWPATLLFWLLIGWPMLLIGWIYRKATRPRRQRSKPVEVK